MYYCRSFQQLLYVGDQSTISCSSLYKVFCNSHSRVRLFFTALDTQLMHVSTSETCYLIKKSTVLNYITVWMEYRFFNSNSCDLSNLTLDGLVNSAAALSSFISSSESSLIL